MALYHQWKIYSQIRVSSRKDVSRSRKIVADIWTHGHPIKGAFLEGLLSTKNKALSLEVNTGCISIRKNLQSRGMHGDFQCARCGASEESINHVFFECPPAVQVWALSKIPSNSDIFPTHALLINMDYLYWKTSAYMEDHQFAWIIWYLRKARNNKIFSNIDVDPRDTLKLAETESWLWLEAQCVNADSITQVRETEEFRLPSLPGRWCFTDESWKAHEMFSGQGWYSTLEGLKGLMGARNTRVSLSYFHSEMEALTCAMESMRKLRQYHVTFATDCIQLVKIVSTPEEWAAFANYLDDIKVLQQSFHHSEIIHIPRTLNTKADNLERSNKKQTSFAVHMDAELPVWFAESF